MLILLLYLCKVKGEGRQQKLDYVTGYELASA